MPLRRLQAEYGTLDSEELTFLQDIFDEVCATEAPKSLVEREAIAAKLLRLFKSGERDREPLRAAVAMATSHLRRAE
jgi:hypothetical protein